MCIFLILRLCCQKLQKLAQEPSPLDIRAMHKLQNTFQSLGQKFLRVFVESCFDPADWGRIISFTTQHPPIRWRFLCNRCCWFRQQLLILTPSCVRDVLIRLLSLPVLQILQVKWREQYTSRCRMGGFRILFQWKKLPIWVSTSSWRESHERIVRISIFFKHHMKE